MLCPSCSYPASLSDDHPLADGPDDFIPAILCKNCDEVYPEEDAIAA